MVNECLSMADIEHFRKVFSDYFSVDMQVYINGKYVTFGEWT